MGRVLTAAALAVALVSIGCRPPRPAPPAPVDPNQPVAPLTQRPTEASTMDRDLPVQFPTVDPARTERTRDGDRDGRVLAADRCPALAEDADGVRDGDGCPDMDDDGDGWPDVADRCDRAPAADNDGCPAETLRHDASFTPRRASPLRTR